MPDNKTTGNPDVLTFDPIDNTAIIKKIAEEAGLPPEKVRKVLEKTSKEVNLAGVNNE